MNSSQLSPLLFAFLALQPGLSACGSEQRREPQAERVAPGPVITPTGNTTPSGTPPAPGSEAASDGAPPGSDRGDGDGQGEPVAASPASGATNDIPGQAPEPASVAPSVDDEPSADDDGSASPAQDTDGGLPEDPDAAGADEPASEAGSPVTIMPTDTFCPPGPYAADPIPDDATAETLCTGMDWVEGPVWDAGTQTLYFSNFVDRDVESNSNGSIMRWQAGQDCTEFIADAGTNGLALGGAGNLVGCRHVDRTVTSFDITTGAPSIVADNFDGKLFSSPNDLAIRGDGNIYFSDPAWNLGNRTEELPQSLYRIDPAGNVSVVEVLDGQRPNGVSLSPDGTLLYVAVLRSIFVYDVATDGSVTNRRDFAEGGADGMAIDCAGNLYTSGGNVFSPQGERIGSFPGGINLAFGGPEGKTLFVTSNGTLRSIELDIPGLPY